MWWQCLVPLNLLQTKQTFIGQMFLSWPIFQIPHHVWSFPEVHHIVNFPLKLWYPEMNTSPQVISVKDLIKESKYKFLQLTQLRLKLQLLVSGLWSYEYGKLRWNGWLLFLLQISENVYNYRKEFLHTSLKNKPRTENAQKCQNKELKIRAVNPKKLCGYCNMQNLKSGDWGLQHSLILVSGGYLRPWISVSCYRWTIWLKGGAMKIDL